MSRKGLLGLMVLVEALVIFGVTAAVAHSPSSSGRTSANARGSSSSAANSGSSVRVSAHASSGSRGQPTNNPFASRALRTWLANRHGRITAAVYDIKTKQEYLL